MGSKERTQSKRERERKKKRERERAKWVFSRILFVLRNVASKVFFFIKTAFESSSRRWLCSVPFLLIIGDDYLLLLSLLLLLLLLLLLSLLSLLLLLQQLDFELNDQRMISKQITMLPGRDKKKWNKRRRNNVWLFFTTPGYFSAFLSRFLTFLLSCFLALSLSLSFSRSRFLSLSSFPF